MIGEDRGSVDLRGHVSDYLSARGDMRGRRHNALFLSVRLS